MKKSLEQLKAEAEQAVREADLACEACGLVRGPRGGYHDVIDGKKEYFYHVGK